MSTLDWIALVVAWLGFCAVVVLVFAGAAKHRRGGGW